jgi:hypothetical protein
MMTSVCDMQKRSSGKMQQLVQSDSAIKWSQTGVLVLPHLVLGTESIAGSLVWGGI